MQFSRFTSRRRYDIADGRCECERSWHDHSGRCDRPLEWWGLGRLASGGWAAVPNRAEAAEPQDDPDAVEAVCWECVIQGLRAEGGQHAA